MHTPIQPTANSDATNSALDEIRTSVKQLARTTDLMLQLLVEQKHANLTKAEFARRIGKSRWTVQKWARDGKLKTQRGLVLYSELAKFTS